jgi:hypothetical protein
VLDDDYTNLTAGPYLLLHLPQALHTAEHVAAPQQEAAKVASVPILGMASRGSDSSAPMISAMSLVEPSLRVQLKWTMPGLETTTLMYAIRVSLGTLMAGLTRRLAEAKIVHRLFVVDIERPSVASFQHVQNKPFLTHCLRIHLRTITTFVSSLRLLRYNYWSFILISQIANMSAWLGRQRKPELQAMAEKAGLKEYVRVGQ